MKPTARKQLPKSADSQTVKRVPVQNTFKTANYRKTTATKESQASNSDVWSCKTCAQDFDDENCELLECEFCDDHFCISCLDISSEEYIILAKRQDIHWYCPQCEANVMVSIRADKDIAQKCADYFQLLDQKLSTLTSRVDEKASKIDFLSLEKQCEAQFQNISTRLSKVDEMLALKLGDSLSATKIPVPVIQTPVHSDHIESNILEIQNREKRKKNLIVFNLAESSSESLDDRKKDDENAIDELLTSQVGVVTSIEKVTRLGSRNSTSDKPRPVCVSVASEQDKWKKLRSANGNSLSFSKNETLRKVFIRKDLTPI